MMNKNRPKRGDIVLCDFSPTAGHEQSGLRPALVLTGVDLTNFTNMIIVCPITSRARGNYFETSINTHKTKGVALIYHLRSIDFRSRKIKIVDQVDKETVRDVVNKVKVLIER